MSNITRALKPRKPSAAMVVALMALFVSLSGGAYAAVELPRDSVGSAQLKASAVRSRNLAAGSVGTKALAEKSVTASRLAKHGIGQAQVASSQIQYRVVGSCSEGSAIQAVDPEGDVYCTPALPTDQEAVGASQTISSTATSPTSLVRELLAAPSPGFYVTSDPYIQITDTNGSENVTVTCTLAQGLDTDTETTAGAVATGTLTFALDTGHEQASNYMPLTLMLPAQTEGDGNGTNLPTGDEMSVSCSAADDGSVAPTVQASATINALEISPLSQANP